ncbi:DEAD/DEAH box helicase, partial [Patescibacteria group bacterium]|nr:DEAD/DEAH box helicase [Patescibacteria group bacterium]
GFLVIDHEQRFGVKQKEKLRKLRTSLDMLSLSATPIPRTLYMSLSSLKGMSMVQTPPEGRFPISLVVCKRNDKIIKEAIEQELKRKGQVYYLHNRVGTIAMVKNKLQKLVPRAKIAIIHGRLGEKELMYVMDEFEKKHYDVLLATTIIENGLDLPNVNTLIVEDATKLGLAQAYQIRGRIGRSHIKSFAWFLYDSNIQDKAQLRLQALQESTELGSGYKIALRDMEIRGAGNILGKEQSGNVNIVGLNLYCQMLSEAVEKLRNKS